MAGLLQEDNGNTSSIRVMSFISLFASIGSGAITLLQPAATESQTGLFMTLMFLVGAFAPKAIQKVAESKLTKG